MYQKIKFLDNDIKPVTKGKFAVIDLGSNSLRLVIFNDIEQYPHQFISERFRAGLAEGKSSEEFILSDNKVNKTLKALKWFDWVAKEQKVENIVVVATSAIRDASNGVELIKRAQDELGILINVINGETEAKLSAIGALNSIKKANGLVIDLGGGSLEIYCTNTKQLVSLPLGVLSLKAKTDSNIEQAKQTLVDELKKHDWIVNSKGTDIIANGGGMRSIAMLHMKKTGYTIQVPQGYEIDNPLKDTFIEELYNEESLSAYFTGYDKKFKTAIPYRAALLDALFSINPNFTKLKFSNFGLREGILFSQIDSKDYNLSEKYAKDMATEKGFGLEYALSSYSFISEILKGLDHDILYLTSLLKDISWRVHKQYRAESLFDSVLHLDFVGIDHKTRAKLALATYFTQESELSLRHKSIIGNILTDKDILRCQLIGQAYKLTELINPARNGDFSESKIFYNADNKVDLETSPLIQDIVNQGLKKRLFEINKLITLLNKTN